MAASSSTRRCLPVCMFAMVAMACLMGAYAQEATGASGYRRSLLSSSDGTAPDYTADEAQVVTDAKALYNNTVDLINAYALYLDDSVEVAESAASVEEDVNDLVADLDTFATTSDVSDTEQIAEDAVALYEDASYLAANISGLYNDVLALAETGDALYNYTIDLIEEAYDLVLSVNFTYYAEYGNNTEVAMFFQDIAIEYGLGEDLAVLAYDYAEPYVSAAEEAIQPYLDAIVVGVETAAQTIDDTLEQDREDTDGCTAEGCSHLRKLSSTAVTAPTTQLQLIMAETEMTFRGQQVNPVEVGQQLREAIKTGKYNREGFTLLAVDVGIKDRFPQQMQTTTTTSSNEALMTAAKVVTAVAAVMCFLYFAYPAFVKYRLESKAEKAHMYDQTVNVRYVAEEKL